MDNESSKPIIKVVPKESHPRWLRFFSQVKRVRKYVDRNVQGGLLSKLAIHWGMFFFTTAFAYIVVQAVLAPNGASFIQRLQNSITEFSLLALLMLTLLPAFLLDVVRFSNRFAGPMVRLRRFLHELGERGDAPPLKFRDDDFWEDIASGFNVCRDRILKQRQEIEQLKALLEKSENAPASNAEAEPSDKASSTTVQPKMEQQGPCLVPVMEPTVNGIQITV
jgi:hypothetical protein